MEKIAWDGPNWGQEDGFLANPDLANILGRMDLDFAIFYFVDFLDPSFLDFQVPRSPNSHISRSPDLQIPRFPDAGAAAGRILRSQPDPSPNAPRDQIRRKGPCCDLIPGCVGRRLWKTTGASYVIFTKFGLY